jgi:hypothetical protein
VEADIMTITIVEIVEEEDTVETDATIMVDEEVVADAIVDIDEAQVQILFISL